MKIKQIHAHFLIPIGDYSNERIGFSVELEENETVESVVSELRNQAVKVVGGKADELYNLRRSLQEQCWALEKRLEKAHAEWTLQPNS